MAPSLRRLCCIALALAALACPAAAHATGTGGAAAPPSNTPTGGSSGDSTGGSPPTRVKSPPTDKPPAPTTPHKKKKKKKKKHKKPPHPTPQPQPQPNPQPGDGPGASDIPPDYLRFYKAAGDAQGVDWRILAAIGKNESDHGRALLPGILSGVNFAGCCAGPMQMCIKKSCGSVWQTYAIDANGDGTASVYDPADAIYAAAALVHGLKTMFGNHPDLILAGYNAGPGNVIHYGGVPPFAETQAYVKHGLAYIATL